MFNFPIPFIAFYHFTFSFCFWVTAGSVTGNNTFPMSTAVKTEFWRLFATAVTARQEEETTRCRFRASSEIKETSFFARLARGKSQTYRNQESYLTKRYPGITVSGHFVPWSDRSKSDRSNQ